MDERIWLVSIEKLSVHLSHLWPDCDVRQRQGSTREPEDKRVIKSQRSQRNRTPAKACGCMRIVELEQSATLAFQKGTGRLAEVDEVTDSITSTSKRSVDARCADEPCTAGVLYDWRRVHQLRALATHPNKQSFVLVLCKPAGGAEPIQSVFLGRHGQLARCCKLGFWQLRGLAAGCHIEIEGSVLAQRAHARRALLTLGDRFQLQGGRRATSGNRPPLPGESSPAGRRVRQLFKLEHRVARNDAVSETLQHKRMSQTLSVVAAKCAVGTPAARIAPHGRSTAAARTRTCWTSSMLGLPTAATRTLR